MVANIPKSDLPEEKRADFEIFDSDTPLDTFWFAYKCLVTRNDRENAVEHLGDDWMDRVKIAAFSLVWDTSETYWCDAFPPGDYRHHDEGDRDWECRWCGSDAQDRFQYFQENLYADDEYWSDLSIEAMASMLSDDITIEGQYEPIWEFSGTFRNLAIQMGATKDLPKVIKWKKGID